MDRPTVWSGREAEALREAMHLSLPDFARQAGVSARAAALWKTRGAGIKLRWDIQQRLDRLLEASTPPAQSRFRLLTESIAGAMFRTVEPAPGLGPFRMEQAVGGLRQAFAEGRSRDTLAEVPRLLGQPLPPKLRSGVYLVASELCLQLGDLPLATYAAQRCREEAEVSGLPLIVAASVRIGARVLRHSGKPKAAAKMAVRAADEVVLDGPRGLSAHGSLLLEGAVAANDLVLVDDAASAAKDVGEGRSFGWTAFGPSNVEIHRMRVLTALGRPHEALTASVKAETLPGERKAKYYKEIARAWDALGDPARALSARKQAQLAAPGLLNG